MSRYPLCNFLEVFLELICLCVYEDLVKLSIFFELFIGGLVDIGDVLLYISSSIIGS